MAESDRFLLAEFISSLGDILHQLVTDNRKLLPGEIRVLAADGWPQIREAIAAVRAEITRPVAGARSLLDEALYRVGLTGIQLQLKLAGFNAALNRRLSERRNSLVRWYKGVLGWANIILGSLATVLPDAEIIKEFKESMEKALDYSGAATAQP